MSSMMIPAAGLSLVSIMRCCVPSAGTYLYSYSY